MDSDHLIDDGNFDGDDGVDAEEEMGAFLSYEDQSGDSGGSDDEAPAKRDAPFTDDDDVEDEVDAPGEHRLAAVRNAVEQTAKPGRDAAARDIFITGGKRRTKPTMSKFEYARVIGVRATEIENGAVDIDEAVIDFCRARGIDKGLDIARVELEMTTVHFPMKIHRRIAANTYEVWAVRELRLRSEALATSFSAAATATLNLGGAATFPYDLARVYARGTSSLAKTGVVV